MLLLYQIYYNYFYSIFIIQLESQNKQENFIAIIYTVDPVWHVEREKEQERNYFNRKEKLFW